MLNWNLLSNWLPLSGPKQPCCQPIVIMDSPVLTRSPRTPQFDRPLTRSVPGHHRKPTVGDLRRQFLLLGARRGLEEAVGHPQEARVLEVPRSALRIVHLTAEVWYGKPSLWEKAGSTKNATKKQARKAWAWLLERRHSTALQDQSICCSARVVVIAVAVEIAVAIMKPLGYGRVVGCPCCCCCCCCCRRRRGRCCCCCCFEGTVEYVQNDRS